MKNLLTAGLCLMMVWPLPAALAAGLEPTISYVYYPVTYTPGQSALDLIIDHSPLGSAMGGKHVTGYTKYNINYKVDYSNPTIDVCRVEDPVVTCDCEITLPRLEGGQPDPAARRDFEAEFNRIKTHELRHCDIAVRHAEMLLAAFQGLDDMPCPEREDILADSFNKIIDSCQVDQTRFDHDEYQAISRRRRAAEAESAAAADQPGFDGDSGPKNLRSIGPGDDGEMRRRGIYKDESGVWRNY